MTRQVCTDCHAVGAPVNTVQGSLLFEVFLHLLWILSIPFILVGIGIITLVVFLIVAGFYSSWRNGTRRLVCPHCGGKPVPLDTPIAAELAPQEHALYLAAMAAPKPPSVPLILLMAVGRWWGARSQRQREIIIPIGAVILAVAGALLVMRFWR